MPFTAVAVYGLEVPAGDVLTPAAPDFPATFRITMAAIDPTEDPEPDEDGHVPPNPRSTLKLVRARVADDADDDELDDEYMKQILAAASDEDDSEDDEEEEANGGPSDPAKSKKQRKAADLAKLMESLKDDEDSDEEMEDAKVPNGVGRSKKGKQKATPGEDDEDEDDEEDDDDEDDESDDSTDGLEFEPFTICTLDTQSHYQQPLDITIAEGEKVFFIVTGTHAVHLSGNYLIDEDEEDSEDDDEYDMDPDEVDYLDEDISDDESDELDGLADPRIKELDTDEEDEEEVEEEEAPKLVPVEKKKGKNKRPADDDANGLDEMMSKEAKADEVKSAKQQKKLKNNKGEAVAVAEDAKAAKADKKVQFAKNLEQGPTGSPLNGKKETKQDKEKEKEKKSEAKQDAKASGDKPGVGVKVVQGVKVDDRKVGTGRTVKNGDTVGVRYIGKLPDGKVFDANKKGKPFSFKVGKGQVIKGWDIGLLGMTIGGERRLTIPAHLAYGSKGMPGIPPNSTLTFDIKLLEIK